VNNDYNRQQRNMLSYGRPTTMTIAKHTCHLLKRHITCHGAERGLPVLGSIQNQASLPVSFTTQNHRYLTTGDDGTKGASSTAVEWRKQQLEKLEKKFTEPSVKIESDEELQPMWKGMESRVSNRRSRTIAEMGGKTGRTNIKNTDEELWLQGGLYDNDEASKKP
jgi:hypothetical protein